jgi:hypothetical protein
VTFLTVPGVSFVLQFSALLFFTAQSSALCYHPSARPVLYPEDWEDPSNPPSNRRMNFRFLCCPLLLARSVAQKRNGKVRQPPGTHLNPAGFLTKREPRLAETAVDTQLGLDQVQSGSGISINRRFATVLFFLLLKPSRNAWLRPRICACPFQLWRVGGIFKFSDLLGFEKGL